MVDVDDILCTGRALGGNVDQLCTADSGNLWGCDMPFNAIDVDDILAVLAAFSGQEYGAGCPYPCGSGGGGMMALDLGDPPPPPVQQDGDLMCTATPSTIAPGEMATIEVFATLVSIHGYQVGLYTTGGTTGFLTLENVSIDVQRQDYVFGDASLDDYPATDLSGARTAAALAYGQSAQPDNEYLATFTFRASPDASGAFTIAFHPDHTFIRKPAGHEGDLDMWNTQITVSE